MTAVIPVFHPRREARRAVKLGYPRDAGSVRLCRDLGAVERMLYQRLVDAVVLDVKAVPSDALALPARFPRIPMFVLSAFRPDDGPLLGACHRAGFTGILVEGVDNAIAGEWIAARTAQRARREALADAPRLLRLTDRLQLAVWEEVLRRVAVPTKTGQLAAALRVTREHLSREFAAGGAPNLKQPGLHRGGGREDPGLRLAQPPGGRGAPGSGRDAAGVAGRRTAGGAGEIPAGENEIACVKRWGRTGKDGEGLAATPSPSFPDLPRLSPSCCM